MLIFMQKINFNYSFFFQILQRNSKLVILGNLDMPYHTHLKWLYQFEETFEVYLQAKNPFDHSRFPYDIPKILKIYNFGCFGHALLRTPEVTLSACRKSTSSPTLFWIYCKDRQTSYFGYFEHTCLNTLKMIAWTCRKCQCLSACRKWSLSFTSFLRYYILKNPATCLAKSILAH